MVMVSSNRLVKIMKEVTCHHTSTRVQLSVRGRNMNILLSSSIYCKCEKTLMYANELAFEDIEARAEDVLKDVMNMQDGVSTSTG